MKTLACTVTGHRPTRFKFKYKENSTGCKRLKKRLHDQFVLLYELGVRKFWVGGALGVDMWAGEILLRLKEQPEYADLELFLALPFEGHDTGWDERSKLRLDFLREHCTGTIVVGTANRPLSENYRQRNEYMVDRSDFLVAVYDDEQKIRSGTGMTFNYARKKKRHIILIHPDTAVVKKIMREVE